MNTKERELIKKIEKDFNKLTIREKALILIGYKWGIAGGLEQAQKLLRSGKK